MYRLLTLNAAFLPRFPGTPALPDHEKRAKILCDLIIESSADIVVLQEVFVPSIREIIVSKLSQAYNIPAGIPINLLADIEDISIDNIASKLSEASITSKKAIESDANFLKESVYSARIT